MAVLLFERHGAGALRAAAEGLIVEAGGGSKGDDGLTAVRQACAHFAELEPLLVLGGGGRSNGDRGSATASIDAAHVRFQESLINCMVDRWGELIYSPITPRHRFPPDTTTGGAGRPLPARDDNYQHPRHPRPSAAAGAGVPQRAWARS